MTDRPVQPLRSLAAFAVATSMLLLGPTPSAHAAAPPTTAAAPEVDAGDLAGDVAGDLAAQRDAAVAARKADPTPARWRAEAQAHEALGNYTKAAEAYRAELDALPEDAIDARRKSEADWARVREASRGAVEGEPASTHRAALDGEWVPPAPPEQLRPVPRPAADPNLDAKDERIITKWYFWVTVAAIAASAGAVAGIAIKAAREERSDALDASGLMPAGGLAGPGVIRF